MYRTMEELKDAIRDAIKKENGKVVLKDESRVRELVDSWVYTSVFSPAKELSDVARLLIRFTAEELGIYPASIYELYKA